MNDFTKEELIDTLLIFNECIAESTQPASIHVLKDKIQTMIYNYCQHKDCAFMVNICDSDILLCNSCNKMFAVYGGNPDYE